MEDLDGCLSCVRVKIVRVSGEVLVNTVVALHTLHKDLYHLVEKHFKVPALFRGQELLDSTKRLASKDDVCLVAHEAFSQRNKTWRVSVKYLVSHKISTVFNFGNTTIWSGIKLRNGRFYFDAGFATSHMYEECERRGSSDDAVSITDVFTGAMCIDQNSCGWKLTADAFY